jgi:hypothetical protein
MHHLALEPYHINHDGDYGGVVHVNIPEELIEASVEEGRLGDQRWLTVKLPAEVFFAYVGAALKSERISEIEQQSGREHLGLKGDSEQVLVSEIKHLTR